MKNIIDKTIKVIKENKWVHLAIIVLIGICLSIPLKEIQVRETHDGYVHILRLIGTLDTLKIGQVPPIVNQNFCEGVRLCNEFVLPTTCNISSTTFKNIY